MTFGRHVIQMHFIKENFFWCKFDWNCSWGFLRVQYCWQWNKWYERPYDIQDHFESFYRIVYMLVSLKITLLKLLSLYPEANKLEIPLYNTWILQYLVGFLWFWGIVFFATTTFVMVIKRENDNNNGSEEEMDQGIVETYKTLGKIIRLPAVKSLILILLTVKVGLFCYCPFGLR